MFPNYYAPGASLLVGALSRRGISIDQLAEDKYADLQETNSCWLFRELDDGECGFRRVRCIEPAFPANTADTIENVFSALVPFVDARTATSRIATPLLAAGNMRRPVSKMNRAILDAEVPWMKTGLPLKRLVIVVEEDDIDDAAKAFEPSLSR